MSIVWKHTTGKNGNLEKHSKSISHKQAMVAWSDYVKNNNERATIAERFDKLPSTQIERNRHYISSVAGLILLFARQTIPLRGYGDESSSSMNRGNFLELMHFISKHDSIVQDHLCGSGSHYTHHQNLILNILADIVRKTISENVKKAGFFSILVDE